MLLRGIAIRKVMSKVTITDHNTIEGILEMARLPDTFISEEVRPISLKTAARFT